MLYYVMIRTLIIAQIEITPYGFRAVSNIIVVSEMLLSQVEVHFLVFYVMLGL